MNEKKVPVCYHHLLVPTQWNQPKPEPRTMITCACGQNASCPVCGYGWGTAPCECDEDDILVSSGILPVLIEEAKNAPQEKGSWEEVLDEILEEYSEAWEELAKL